MTKKKLLFKNPLKKRAFENNHSNTRPIIYFTVNLIANGVVIAFDVFVFNLVGSIIIT